MAYTTADISLLYMSRTITGIQALRNSHFIFNNMQRTFADTGAWLLGPDVVLGIGSVNTDCHRLTNHLLKSASEINKTKHSQAEKKCYSSQ